MIDYYLIIGGVILLFHFLVQLYIYVGLGRLRKSKQQVMELPPLSVIVALKNEEVNVPRLIEGLKNQEYQNYEVILVDDRSTDNTYDRLVQATSEDDRFRVVSLAASENHISGKKAALDRGIKNASFEHLVFTDADCLPSDEHWLSRFGEAFGRGVEVVVGTGLYDHNGSVAQRLYSIEAERMAMLYHAAASNQHPYMCVGRSMGYTATAFRAAGGFERYAEIATGSDDLLLQSFPAGTRIESIPQAATISEPPSSFEDWVHQKKRHLGAAPFYPWHVRLLLFFNELTMIATPIVLLFAIVLDKLVYDLLIILFMGRVFVAWNNHHVFTRLTLQTRRNKQVWWLEYPASWTNALLSILTLWVKRKGWKIDLQGQAPSEISSGLKMP